MQQTTSGAYDAGDVKYTNVCHDGYKLADGDPGNKYNSRCELDSENISYEYNYQLMNENGSLSKITTCTGPDSDACTIGVDWSLPNSNTVSCPGYTFAQWLTFGGYHDAGVSVACSVAELGSGSPVAIAGIMCDCQRTNYCNSASSGRTRICINACGQDCTSPRDLQPGFTVDEDLGG